MKPVRPTQCATCIFRPGNLMRLMPGRHAEIRAYLLEGTPHLCHSPGPSGRTDELACRGGRDFQLEIWHRMGIIAAPTDEALAEAMAEARGDAEGSTH